MFDENYFIETLKIPLENVKGFQYYYVADINFLRVLKQKIKQ